MHTVALEEAQIICPAQGPGLCDTVPRQRGVPIFQFASATRRSLVAICCRKQDLAMREASARSVSAKRPAIIMRWRFTSCIWQVKPLSHLHPAPALATRHQARSGWGVVGYRWRSGFRKASCRPHRHAGQPLHAMRFGKVSQCHLQRSGVIQFNHGLNTHPRRQRPARARPTEASRLKIQPPKKSICSSA